jgi:hypothetical protein
VKASNVIALVLGAGVCIGLCGCGGHDSGMMSGQASQPAPPFQPQMLMLSVDDVLGRAKGQSETDEPLAVNGGVVTVNPANDEESDAVSVD